MDDVCSKATMVWVMVSLHGKALSLADYARSSEELCSVSGFPKVSAFPYFLCFSQGFWGVQERVE